MGQSTLLQQQPLCLKEKEIAIMKVIGGQDSGAVVSTASPQEHYGGLSVCLHLLPTSECAFSDFLSPMPLWLIGDSKISCRCECM